MKRNAIWFVILQIVVVISMYVYYKELALVPYINVSFIVGGTVLFIGLVIFVFSTGVFDLFSSSMRKVFLPKHVQESGDWRNPSEIFDFPFTPFLYVGGAILLCMGVALFAYYG